MTYEVDQPDEIVSRDTFSWLVAYSGCVLCGGILPPAWAYYVWMKSYNAALQAGEPVDYGPGLFMSVALVGLAVVGAIGALVLVGLAHLAATLYGALRRRRIRQSR